MYLTYKIFSILLFTLICKPRSIFLFTFEKYYHSFFYVVLNSNKIITSFVSYESIYLVNVWYLQQFSEVENKQKLECHPSGNWRHIIIEYCRICSGWKFQSKCKTSLYLCWNFYPSKYSRTFIWYMKVLIVELYFYYWHYCIF